MAKEYRFYKISEANAEIARLEGELAKAQSIQSEDSEIANQAEEIRRERDSIKSENESLKKQLESITKEREDARAEAAKAKSDAAEHCKDFDGKVESAASKKALSITAGQGQPPIAQMPAATPAAEPQKPALTGLERTKAAFRAQLASK